MENDISMESVTILHNNCNIRRVDDPAMTSIGYVIFFPSITRFGVHFVLLLTFACYTIIRYYKWSSRLFCFHLQKWPA